MPRSPQPRGSGEAAKLCSGVKASIVELEKSERMAYFIAMTTQSSRHRETKPFPTEPLHFAVARQRWNQPPPPIPLVRSPQSPPFGARLPVTPSEALSKKWGGVPTVAVLPALAPSCRPIRPFQIFHVFHPKTPAIPQIPHLPSTPPPSPAPSISKKGGCLPSHPSPPANTPASLPQKKKGGCPSRGQTVR